MIEPVEGVKVFNKIFIYPKTMSDAWIDKDPIRLLINSYFGKVELETRDDLWIIFAHGIKKRTLKSWLARSRGKKVLFIYCGENVFSKVKLLSYAYAVLQKTKMFSRYRDKILLNRLSRKVLDISLPNNNGTFINELIKERSDYFFILTNDFAKKNVFFAPYFYFFCRQLIIPLADREMSLRNDVSRKFCAFVVSNPGNVDRIDFFNKLSKYRQIDSYGRVLNNSILKEEKGEHYLNLLEKNHLLYEKYKFVITFENSYSRGYITEKIVNALAGGAIPIYRGAPDVLRFFNRERIIDYNDYDQSYENMIAKIIELDNDDDKYNEMTSKSIFANNQLSISYSEFDNRLKAFIESMLTNNV